MRPRIEIVEVISFRLQVSRQALDQLVEELGSELPLALEPDGADVLMSLPDADCQLRFASLGDELELTEVLICNDDGGAFFSRVLGRLMSDHRGDLEAKLQWNSPERNSQGSYAAVAFARGKPVPTRVQGPAAALRNTLVAGEQQGELMPLSATPEQAPVEDEIAQLLTRAKQAWAEYQRLKAKRES